MEQFKCLECNAEFNYRKTLGRHIKDVHKLDWLVYNEQHGKSETRVCHCGKSFENNRYPGGPNRYGRSKKHCSPQCVQIATNCRFRGITTEVYWDAQKNGCTICGGFDCSGGRRIHLDHDHKTGKFRGGLCTDCNSGLGMFKDDPELLKKAVAYLQR